MFQDEDKVQARRRQSDTAIQLAMANRWEEAAQVNRSILTLFPNDVDSHNRLGKALMELGRYPDSKKSYKKALELDATNQIARKNLERLTMLTKAGVQAETSQIDPTLFIEEMGKSAVTNLRATKPETLAKLNAGDKLELRRDNGALVVETPSGEVIGAVEPKLTVRLIKLIDGGNQYAAAVTNLSKTECRIIIKETYQHPSLAGRPSFPATVTAEGGLRPYTKDSLIRHDNQPDDVDREEEDIEDHGEETEGESWESERVVQEGHLRLNEAAAAEDLDDEEEE